LKQLTSSHLTMSHLLPLHVAKVAHQDQSSELNRRSGTTSSAQPRNWKQATTEDNALMKKKTPLIPIPVVWRLALIAVTIQCCSVLGLVFRVGHNTFSLVAEFLFWSGALATLAALPLLLYQLLLLHRIGSEHNLLLHHYVMHNKKMVVLCVASLLLSFFLFAHLSHALGYLTVVRWIVRPIQCRSWSPALSTEPALNNIQSVVGLPHMCLVTGPIGRSRNSLDRFDKVASVVLAQKIKYAQSHPKTSVFTFDRDVVEARAPHIPPHLRRFWAKPASLAAVLQEHEYSGLYNNGALIQNHTHIQSEFGRCDWVVWFDLDTVIMETRRPLQSFVQESNDDVIIGEEAGAFFLRNSKPVQKLINTWLGTTNGMYGDALDDGALQHLLADGVRTHALRVRRAAQCEFSSYFHFWDIAHRWTCGDFAVHQAGDRHKMERLLMMVEMANQRHCMPPLPWMFQ
jgi:hypothetical protein